MFTYNYCGSLDNVQEKTCVLSKWSCSIALQLVASKLPVKVASCDKALRYQGCWILFELMRILGALLETIAWAWAGNFVEKCDFYRGLQLGGQSQNQSQSFEEKNPQ